MQEINERLMARGIGFQKGSHTINTSETVEARVDPLSFQLDNLANYSDATKGVPIETHRSGFAGKTVHNSKKLFRRFGQIFINETLARQTLFNEAATDSYAMLSAEIIQLRKRVESLEAALKKSNSLGKKKKLVNK